LPNSDAQVSSHSLPNLNHRIIESLFEISVGSIFFFFVKKQKTEGASISYDNIIVQGTSSETKSKD